MTRNMFLVCRDVGLVVGVLALALLVVSIARAATPVQAAPSCEDGVRIDWIRSEGRRATGRGVDVATGGGAAYLLSIQTPPTIKRAVATVSKYGAAGKRQWIVTLPGPARRSVADAQLVVGSDGRLYVVEVTAGATPSVFLNVLTTAGEVAIHKSIGRGTSALIAAAPDAAVYVEDGSVLRRYRIPDLSLEWTETVETHTSAIATDDDGGVYLVGSDGIERRNPRNVEWQDGVYRDFDEGLDEVHDVAVRGDHVSIVFTWRTENYLPYIGWARYAPDGTQDALHVQRIHTTAAKATGITEAADGFGWIVGYDGRRALFDVLAPGGDNVASRTLRGTTPQAATSMTAVAPGATGAVYASGWSTESRLLDHALGGQAILVRLSRC